LEAYINCKDREPEILLNQRGKIKVVLSSIFHYVTNLTPSFLFKKWERVLDEVHQSLDNMFSNVLSKQHLLLEPSHPRTFPLSEQQQLCLRSP